MSSVLFYEENKIKKYCDFYKELCHVLLKIEQDKYKKYDNQPISFTDVFFSIFASFNSNYLFKDMHDIKKYHKNLDKNKYYELGNVYDADLFKKSTFDNNENTKEEKLNFVLNKMNQIIDLIERHPEGSAPFVKLLIRNENFDTFIEYEKYLMNKIFENFKLYFDSLSRDEQMGVVSGNNNCVKLIDKFFDFKQMLIKDSNKNVFIERLNLVINIFNYIESKNLITKEDLDNYKKKYAEKHKMILNYKRFEGKDMEESFSQEELNSVKKIMLENFPKYFESVKKPVLKDELKYVKVKSSYVSNSILIRAEKKPKYFYDKPLLFTEREDEIGCVKLKQKLIHKHLVEIEVEFLKSFSEEEKLKILNFLEDAYHEIHRYQMRKTEHASQFQLQEKRNHILNGIEALTREIEISRTLDNKDCKVLKRKI